jgi:hypothetical protein
VARPEDLRWFANILASAEEEKGKYFIAPRDKLEREQEELARLKQAQEEALRLEEEEKVKAAAAELEALQKLEAELELEAEREVEVVEEKESPPKKEDKKGKKGKKSKKDKGKDEGKAVKESKSKKTVEKKDETTGGKAQEPEQAEGKKRKGDKKKKGKRKKDPEPVPEPEPEMIEEEEEVEVEVEMPAEILPELEPLRPRSSKLRSYEEGKYPEDISEVKGLYGPEPMESVVVTPYPHESADTERKTLVVRSLMELPLIDDQLQESLLVASKAYSNSVEVQKKMFSGFKIKDPRTEEEKEQERLIKKELVEENIQYMHLLQQASGKLLDLAI